MEIRSKEVSLYYLRLDEEVSRVLALCREAGIAVEDLMELQVKRQREKATERLLLCRAFGQPVSLCHDEQGAPFVEGFDVNISITHTPHLVAVAINEHQVVGVDAEQMNRQQVLRVRDKFLNDKEKLFIAPDDLAAHVIAWTAKEAIIKAERNSALDWTNGICLEPFAVDVSNLDQIPFAARCGTHCYCLNVRAIEGHFLTLATPCSE